jgi:hypothetical protein
MENGAAYENRTRTQTLARLAINFKNAGNGGFFNVFEVPQMENGWKMEDGKWKMENGVIVK